MSKMLLTVTLVGLVLMSACRKEERSASINTCQSNEDCQVVYIDVCGQKVAAVPESMVEQVEKQVAAERRRSPLILCQPALPLNIFEGLCVNGRCKAYYREQRGILYFEKDPIIGETTTLIFAFKFSTPSPRASAFIDLPESFEWLEGDLDWKGRLRVGEEVRMQVKVRPSRAGFFTLQAVGVQEDGTYPVTDKIQLELSPDGAFYDRQAQNGWEGDSPVSMPLAENNQQIQGEIVVEGQPALGSRLTVIYRVIPLIDLPEEGVLMSLQIPSKGLKIVSVDFPTAGSGDAGSLQWRGAIARGHTAEIRLVLEVTEYGWGKIFGVLAVQALAGVEKFISDVRSVEIYVDQYYGRVAYQ